MDYHISGAAFSPFLYFVDRLLNNVVVTLV